MRYIFLLVFFSTNLSATNEEFKKYIGLKRSASWPMIIINNFAQPLDEQNTRSESNIHQHEYTPNLKGSEELSLGHTNIFKSANEPIPTYASSESESGSEKGNDDVYCHWTLTPKLKHTGERSESGSKGAMVLRVVM